MWKAIIAGTAAAAIASTSLVYAQQAGRRDGGQRWQPGVEDMRAFGEARLAALKAGTHADIRAGKKLARLRTVGARFRKVANGSQNSDAQCTA